MGTDFRLEDWIVRPHRNCIERGGKSIHIHPKPMAVLEHLAASGGAVVTRDELFESVWPGVIVTDDALAQCIAELRKAFGDSAHDSQVIQTVPKVGFRLLLPVSGLSEGQAGTDDKLKFIIVGTLVLVTVFFALYRFIPIGEEPVSTADNPAPKTSIAVLPFVNRSMQPENEYFTDGMHDEVLSRLTGIPALRVISRTSVNQYRNTEKSLPQIAQELSVGTVLEGGVQRTGNQVRINVQLIDARTDGHIWSEMYDRQLTATNVFRIQSEIALKIANALGAELSPEVRARVQELPTLSMEAYNHYLRGRQLSNARGTENWKMALQEFELAVEIDSEYALAWTGVSLARHMLLDLDISGADITLERSRHAVERALELDNQLGVAWGRLAAVHNALGNAEEMMAACDKALELSPNQSYTYHYCAGRVDNWRTSKRGERLAWYYKAAQLDPLSSSIQQTIALNLRDMGRIEEAREQFHRILKENPGFAAVYSDLGVLHQSQGHLAEAVQWFRKGVDLDPSGRNLSRLGKAYLILGDMEAADRTRKKMIRHLGPESRHLVLQEFQTSLAKWKLDELGNALGRPPPEFDYRWVYSWLAIKAAIYQQDMPEARERWLRLEPRWADPDNWELLVDEQFPEEGCYYAGILIGTGDEALGNDLARRVRRLTEEVLAEFLPVAGRWRGHGLCHLVEGDYDKALDFYEQLVAQGYIWDAGYASWDWLNVEKLPWWNPVRDHHRYVAMVEKIEELRVEQRELLRQMEGTVAVMQ